MKYKFYNTFYYNVLNQSVFLIIIYNCFILVVLPFRFLIHVLALFFATYVQDGLLLVFFLKL